MRKNRKTKIIGSKVVLVPYRESHVKRYNEWMQVKELQELTASDPLTEEEEYQMQKTWLADEDKCTFIVLEEEILKRTQSEELKFRALLSENIFECMEESMIGDTNLYLSESDIGTQAETCIMIAEPLARRKRMGWEAMLMHMKYGMDELNVKRFVAKISMNNIKSIEMFKKMGFEKESESEVFQEITLIKDISEDWAKWLNIELIDYNIVETEENK